jgi:hypothetical protein
MYYLVLCMMITFKGCFYDFVYSNDEFFYHIIKMCHFNTPILEWVLPIALLFNLMIDFEVLVLMVPSDKNTISNDLKI